MNKALPSFAAVALLALAACNNKPVEVTSIAPDPQAAEMANRAPIELPPAVKADVTFRCKDNSLAYVSFFEGDKQALLRTTKDGTPTKVVSDTAGGTMSADGYSVKGTPKAITLTRPGKGELTCKA